MQRLPYPQITPSDDPDYPSCDGNPMSDNTRQFLWITTVQGGLDALFIDDPDVVVAGDCLWYPVEGNNKIRIAPDTMVIFGRPKGHRGSFIQHREGGVGVQVVFEVLSPGNRAGEMRRKLAFYEQYGVEEYYILDPDFARHKGHLRADDGTLEPLSELFGWTSPRLGVRFEMTKELRIIAPDGRPFESYVKIVEQRGRSERQAEQERERADEERERADEERERAEQADRRAGEERRRLVPRCSRSSKPTDEPRMSENEPKRPTGAPSGNAAGPRRRPSRSSGCLRNSAPRGRNQRADRPAKPDRSAGRTRPRAQPPRTTPPCSPGAIARRPASSRRSPREAESPPSPTPTSPARLRPHAPRGLPCPQPPTHPEAAAAGSASASVG